MNNRHEAEHTGLAGLARDVGDPGPARGMIADLSPIAGPQGGYRIMTEPRGDFDLKAVRGWIGREASAHDIVTSELVRRYRATFDEPCDDLSPGRMLQLSCISVWGRRLR